VPPRRAKERSETTLDHEREVPTSGGTLVRAFEGVDAIRLRLDFVRALEGLRDLDEDARVPVVLNCAACDNLFAWFAKSVKVFHRPITVAGRPVTFDALDWSFHAQIERGVRCEHCGALDDYTFAVNPLIDLMEVMDPEDQTRAERKTMLATRLLCLATAQTTDGRTLALSEQVGECLQALERDPDDLRSAIRLVHLWKNLRQASRALELAERTLARFPDSVEMLIAAASVRMDRGEHGRARAYLRPAAMIILARRDRYRHDDPDGVRQAVTAGLAVVRKEVPAAWSDEDERNFLALQKVSGLMIFDGTPGEPRRAGPRRNEPCPCGSARKFRKCCRPKLGRPA
jgi:hypothetical protein